MLSLATKPINACIMQYGRVLFVGTVIECLNELADSYRSIDSKPTLANVLEHGFVIQTIH